MKVMGLFSGIGGFERAFEELGMECAGMCEIDDPARMVLKHHFPNVKIHGDIRNIKRLPKADVLTAGFPCQDLSQAGLKIGITGERSGLVDEIFRLLAAEKNGPEWVILENVSYMLKLKQGGAMRYLLERIESLGYRWAYRVIDARCFGLPQRRERVVMLLSKRNDPATVLFPDGFIESGIDDRVGEVSAECLYGFYWTEGKRGLGWTRNAVPTIKGGSGLGIPSPPAIWDPVTGAFGTPSISDAERMCGFDAGWTSSVDVDLKSRGARWKLVGNTICVPMVDWVAQQLVKPAGLNAEVFSLKRTDRPPPAAFGGPGKQRKGVSVSRWVHKAELPNLRAFLSEPLKPLSLRASTGFYNRAIETTTIRFAEGFLESLELHIREMTAQC